MDVNGPFSEARKQIEGVATSADGKRVAITHEGRKAMVTLVAGAAGELTKSCDFSPLANVPYWVTLDSAEKVAFVSIPGNSTVEAYDISQCTQKPLWTAQVGGKPKRMAVVNQ
jgi:hypothetical protein